MNLSIELDRRQFSTQGDEPFYIRVAALSGRRIDVLGVASSPPGGSIQHQQSDDDYEYGQKKIHSRIFVGSPGSIPYIALRVESNGRDRPFSSASRLAAQDPPPDPTGVVDITVYKGLDSAYPIPDVERSVRAK